MPRAVGVDYLQATVTESAEQTKQQAPGNAVATPYGAQVRVCRNVQVGARYGDNPTVFASVVECLGCGKYGHPFLQSRNACQ